MKHNKLYAIITLPIILSLYSYLGKNNTRVMSDKKEISNEYIEAPDHIYSAEYRMILEKTFIELYGTDITQEMRNEDYLWMGFCTDCHQNGEDVIIERTNKKCGDKVKWGGKIFCLSW